MWRVVRERVESLAPIYTFIYIYICPFYHFRRTATLGEIGKGEIYFGRKIIIAHKMTRK